MMDSRSIGKWLFCFWGALFMMACGDDLPGEEQQRMEIQVRLGSPGATTRSIGDPGTDHGEWTAEVDSIALFLVYGENDVVVKKFLASNLTETDGVYKIPLYVKSGTVVAYAVAYRSPQGFDETHFKSVENILNMKSLDLDEDAGLFGKELTDGSEKKTATAQEYMRNLFSGSKSGIIIPLNESVTIQLDRQIAKVDVQWDVQDAYDAASGKYTEVGMSNITFYGMTFCYLFPDKKTTMTETPGLVTTGAYTCSSAISQRNGRAYFYTFPEEESTATTTEKVKFEFTLTYTGASDPLKKYTATFSDLLKADVWYKVNINVKGMSTDTGGDITEITLGKNE